MKAWLDEKGVKKRIEPFVEPIYVTRPYLPPLEEFVDGLKEIWDNRWLTNNGPLVQRFREDLSRFFQTDNVSLFVNGTLALQIALQGLGITGEVITTPYTFVATSHALYWNKIRPVFVDIEPTYYTIDPEKVEAAITPWTSAILAVHVYGFPCRHKELEDIARRHNLKLIYDAAHAFGVEVDGKPIAHWGDVSMFSFHATKIYHSIEGGALVFQNPSLQKTFDYLKNFGFESETEVVMPGTNAKMNEFQALMGILVLKHLDEIIQRGREIEILYREALSDVPGIKIPPPLPENVSPNYGYMPIEVEAEEFGMSRDELYGELKKYNIHARRYFYPLISDYACFKHIFNANSITTARSVSEKILCLPTFTHLEDSIVDTICQLISQHSKQ